MTATTPYVYIVDDDEAICESLKLLLKSVGIPAVSHSTAEAFLQQYDPKTAACLVLDVRMEGMSGLELQRQLNKMEAPISIIIMTGHGDIEMAVEAMKNGAAEFMVKPFDNKILLDRIRTLWKQSEEIQQEYNRHTDYMDRLARLTNREKEVMDLMVTGKHNKTVASILGISPRTVELHRARIMEKLHAKSLSDVVRIALACE